MNFQRQRHGSCKLCKERKPLAHSHILPEFVYKPLYSPSHKFIGIRSDSSSSVIGAKRLQKGLREHLLCSDCETFLNRHYEQPGHLFWEALAYRASRIASPILRLVPTTDRRTGLRLPALAAQGIEYTQFKLLLLSFLWRASVVTLPEFHAVSLGPHEERIRQMLLKQDAGKPEHYPCLLCMIDFRAMSLPVRFRIPDRVAYRFHLPNLLLIFVVDSHIPSSDDLVRMSLQTDGSIVIPIVESTPETVDAIEMVKKSPIKSLWLADR